MKVLLITVSFIAFLVFPGRSQSNCDFSPAGLSAQEIVDTLYYFSEKYWEQSEFDDFKTDCTLENVNKISLDSYQEVVANDDSLFLEYAFSLGAFYLDYTYTFNNQNAWEKSKYFFKKLGNLGKAKDKGSAYLYLGQLNFWNNKYDKALKDFRRSITEFELSLDSCNECIEGLLQAKIGLAELYYDIKNYEKAERLYKSIDYGEIVPQYLKYAWVMNQSKVSNKLKQHLEAITLIDYVILNLKDDTTGLQSEYYDEALLLKASYLNDLDQQSEASKVLEMVDSENFYEDNKRISYLVVKSIARSKSDPEGANEYFKEAIKLAKKQAYKKDLLISYKELYYASITYDISKPPWLLDSLYELTLIDLETAYTAQNGLVVDIETLNDSLNINNEHLEAMNRSLKKEKNINFILFVALGIIIVIVLIVFIVLVKR